MIPAQKIYLIGIGGIGMSGLARLFLAAGKQVSGSDLRDSNILENARMLGANVFIGHDIAHIDSEKPDLVIYSADITEESAGFAELKAAKAAGIETMTYAQALGYLMEGKTGVAVTGTNGKSTTSAMLALILDQSGVDPMALIGTQISSKNASHKFQSNARSGNGEIFVAEADEYMRKMLTLKPKVIVLTNITEDHLDYFKDLADIKSAFTEFVQSLLPDGMVIYNADDHNTVEVARHAKCHKFTFGIHHYADLQALNLRLENGRQKFDLHLNDQMIGTFELNVPGKFNVSNALGAALAAIKLGVDIEVIKKSLSEFAGTWRRFETVGQLEGKVIISDYGHHPAAITGTIEAYKEFYPGQKVLLVFQPHHRNRTHRLFGEFVEALVNADNVIVPEIFDVAGREHGENISSRDLVVELKKAGMNAEYAKDLDETEKMIRSKLNDFDVVILMGAGDIDQLARKLVSK